MKRTLPTARMLTLLGTGGVGKTRLALRVATQSRRAFPDGVWLVELAALQDRALLDQAVADAVGLRDQSMRSPREALAGYLRDKHLLLVLDNCEHLGDECAVLAAELLATAPQLRILATSRQALNTPGEHILPIPPLPVPDLDRTSPRELATNDAVRLFGERVAAVVPEFAVTEANRAAVARICRRLDGLPLAIELAAAWVQMLSLEQILHRLDNRFRLLTGGAPAVLARHRTLRAVVDWSYELCSPAEQRLWARMSVFAGGFDLDAAEEVCAGEGIEREEVLDVVAGLVDKSILAAEEQRHGARVRYRVLDTIGHYGWDQLRARGEQEVLRRRHRNYFVGLAERGAAEWFGPAQLEIAARTRGEHANLRLALEYCLCTPGESQTGLRLAAALLFYWYGCGFLAEGRHWLDRMLASDSEPSRARATALWATAILAVAQGDPAALDLATQCWQWAQAQGEQTVLAYALFVLGIAAGTSGDLPYGQALLEDALGRFEAQGELNSIVIQAFVSLSELVAFQGDLDHAIALAENAYALAGQHDERWARAYTLLTSSLSLWLRGELVRAHTHAQEALRDMHAFNDVLGMALLIERLAWIAGTSGEGERAAVLLGMASRLWPLLGGLSLANFQPYVDAHEACARQARRVLGDRGFQVAFDRGAGLDRDQALAYALGEDVQGAPAASAAADGDPLGVLTRRERQVVELVAEGLSNKEIAARLVIAQRTAEGHVERILAKVGFTRRVQLASWYTERRQSRSQ